MFSEFGSIDLPPSQLSSLATTASLLQRDTDLFYTSLVVVSRKDEKLLHSPVLLYPVNIIEQEGSTQLQIDYGRLSLNPALFHLFDLPPDFENKILSLLPTGELNLATPGLLAQDLAQHIPKLDTSPFDSFPQLLSSSEVKAHHTNKQPTLLPASTLLLTEKSKNVAGLLHELEELITQPISQFPPALSVFLKKDPLKQTQTQEDRTNDYSATQLSPSQQQLLRSADEQALTVCHGPPGTGKTFTVAAAALDQISRSKSVLIACRSEEAAAIIESKLNELLPQDQLVIRAGRSQHLKNLKTQVDQLLGTRPIPPPLPSSPGVSLGELNSILLKLRRKLKKRVFSESKVGEYFSSTLKSTSQKIQLWVHCLKLKRAPLLAQLVSRIIETQARRLRLIENYHHITYHRNLQSHLSSLTSREVLKRYREAIGRRIPAAQERELLELDLETLLNYLPIWITTTDDIHRVLPLKPALFDLVIIDEATQCDLASALPILYRGQRAFITGDPQQLRHLSFLSKDRLDSLAEKHQLSALTSEEYDFRRVSFLDRALVITAGSTALNFLDEHFRSLPPLIEFSNQHFYQGNLHCMREVEVLSQKPSTPPFVVNTQQGRRDQNGVNNAEITAAFDYLRQHLANNNPATLGFLSPFRAQVDTFQDRLQKEFSPSLQQLLLRDHQLIAGTAHSFQGAERDIMLISFAIDPQSPSAARRFLERPDVFNVATTRARNQIQLFTSLTPNDLPLNSLLCQYLLHTTSEERATQSSSSEDAIIPSQLLNQMEAHDWQLLATGTQVAGMPIDLLFKRDKQLLAIDLIGTPDHLGAAVSVEKTLLLKRAGLPLHPLSAAEWQVHPEDFLKLVNSP